MDSDPWNRNFGSREMMGFGSYGGNGGSSSLSSNLSALAPPFTVERPITKPNTSPLVDLVEPKFDAPQNWVNPSRTDYFSDLDSVPFAKPYRYTSPKTFTQPQTAAGPSLDTFVSASNDAFSYSQNPDGFKNEFVEAEPYYPSYFSPSVQHPAPKLVATFIGPSTDPKLSGSENKTQWGGLWEDFPDWRHSKKVDVGRNFYSNEMNMASPTNFKDRMNSETQAPKEVKTFEELVDDTSVLPKQKQAESANTGKRDFVSILGQTSSSMPTFVVQDPQLSHGKTVKSSKNLMSFSNPYGNFTREHGTTSPVIRPPVIGSSSSGFKTEQFQNVNSFNDTAKTDSAFSNPFSMKEPHPLLGPAGGLRFDPSKLSIHLDGNHLPTEVSSGKTEGFSSNKVASKDTSNQFYVGSGVQFSHANASGFNMTADNNIVNQVEKSTESSDCYYPAVDSPCWKGAPVPLYSPFGSSGAVATQILKKPEASSGSNNEASKCIPINAAKVSKGSHEKNGESSVSEENRRSPIGLFSSKQWPRGAELSFRVNESNDPEKVGSNHGSLTYGYGFQFSDDTNQPRKEYALFNKSFTQSGLKSSCTVQQCFEKEKSPYSLSSKEDVAVKHVESREKESAQKINVHAVVETMFNMSELLLVHCSNEECELRTQDLESLKNAIKNLDKCMAKNIGQESSTDPNKGKSKIFPQTEAVDIVEETPRHLQEKRKYSEEKDESSAIFFGKNHAEKAEDHKNNKMTQAIKKVLSENFDEKEEVHPQSLFYKNLWLEAEAAFCSMNFMARYNRVKLEMDQSKLGLAKGLSEDTTGEENISNTYSLMKTDEKSGPASEVGSVTDDPVLDSSIISTSSNVDDVIARFNILKNRLENFSSDDAADKGKISSPKVSSTMDKIDDSAPEVNYTQITELSPQNDPKIESPVMARLRILKSRDDNLRNPEVNYSQITEFPPQDDNVEASFLTRLRILQTRDLNSSPVDVEWQPFSKGCDFGLSGQINQWSGNNDGADGEMLHANIEPNLKVKHGSFGQSPGSSNKSGNLLYAGWHDGSSDWEHVLKEELSGQNS